MNQAERVIAKFSVVEIDGEYLRVNGAQRIAKLLGITTRAVYHWTHPTEKRGTGGLIPIRSLQKVKEAALKVGILLTAEDLYSDDL